LYPTCTGIELLSDGIGKIALLAMLERYETIEMYYSLLTIMTTVELFPTLKNLPRADKLKVMQFLITELAREEEPTLQPGATYTLLSPLDSHEAVHQLAQLLEAEQISQDA
jgi:hypothetical protein